MRVMPSTGGEAPTLRLFYALWPDAATVDTLDTWARRAQRQVGGRVMRPDTLHLTLAFLGAVPQARVAALCALTQALTWQPQPLVLDHLGRFRGPRIVWAGPQAAVPWLAALHEQLAARLSALGCAPPDPRFRAHLSLVRRIEDKPLSDSMMTPPVVWTPRRLVLAVSRPGQGSSTYQFLAEQAR